jgi:zinc protease
VPTIDEQIARVEATSLEQVQSLYANYLGSGQGELVVVGDFEPSQIRPHVARALDGWNADRPYARIEHPYQADLKPGRETVLTPGKANAVYFAGLAVPVRDDHPDYAALVVANFILGGAEYDNRGFKDEETARFTGQAFPADGGVSSRLVDRLRHRGGLSYGAASFFTASDLDHSARLMIYANTSPNKIPEVEAAAAEELRRWVKEGITPGELDRARTGYLLQHEVDRANDATLAALLARQLHDGRTMTFVADLEDDIRRLTAEGVSRAVQRHIDPARLSTVTAGDLESKDRSAAK